MMMACLKQCACLSLFLWLSLFPSMGLAATAGNVDGAGGVDLKDAVAALKACAGNEVIAVYKQYEISGDGKVCLEEAVYALRAVAGLRPTEKIWYKDADGDQYSDGVRVIAAARPSGDYFEEEDLLMTEGDPDDEDASAIPGVGVTVETTYAIPPIQATPTALGDDDQLLLFNFGNAPLAGDPGKPVLPVIPASILLPSGFALDQVEVSTGAKDGLPGSYTIEYGQRQFPLLPDVEPTITQKDMGVYGSDAPYPANRYELVGVQKYRGASIVNVNLHPVEYLPASGKVSYFKNISVKVTTKPDVQRRSRGADIRFRPSGLKPLSRMVDNPEVVDGYVETPPRLQKRASGLCDPADSFQYVLVTSGQIINASTVPNVNDLIALRRAQGLSATVVAIEDVYANYSGVDNAEKLRNFLKDAYNLWETDFVLLGGDTNIIPMRKLWCEAWEGSPYVDHIPSDLYYQCLDGTYNADGDDKWGEPNDGENGGDVDLYAELYVGRASAENADEMANFIYKTMAYEGESVDFKKQILMCGEHLGFGGVSEYAKSSMEEIRNGSSKHGYSTAGFGSDGSFSVNGLYQKDENWGKSDIIDTINLNDYSVINHLGHANYNYVMQMLNSDAGSLGNPSPMFAYSQGCIPGNFEEDCIAERLTTSARQGMFAVVFNSRYGWGRRDSTDGASQRYNREFWDAYFTEGMTHLGAMNADSHEDNAWRVNQECMRWCFYESNLLGDPAVRFAVEVAQDQPPVADAGDDQTKDIGDAVVLSGAGSSDPDGSVVGYFWAQTAGPSVALTGVNAVNAGFVAPDLGTEGGHLVFKLTVTDNDGLKASDSCKVIVGGKADGIVVFPDGNLEAAIREAIDKPAGDILESDLEGLVLAELDAGEYQKPDGEKIQSIEGLQYCKDLTKLDLYNNQIADMSAVAELTNLTYLNLGRNQIADMSVVAGLSNLTSLDLFSNQIDDMSAVTELIKLRYLRLSRNQITDMSAVAELTNLTSLDLAENRIAEMSAVAGLTNLTSLDLGMNRIADMSAVVELTNLTSLDISSNQINDNYMSSVAGLKNLTKLDLCCNQISDISVVSELTKLERLSLHYNQIADMSAVSGLTNLTFLSLSKNQIADMSAVAGLSNLTWIALSENQIADISVVVGLTNLTRLSLDDNQIAAISPLIENDGIGEGDFVDIESNPLNDTACTQHIPALESRGVDISHGCP